MATVRIAGWKPGFKKISHAKLLQAYAGLGIAAAKEMTDRVSEGGTVDVNIDDHRVEEFLDRLRELGALTARVESSDPGEGRPVNRSR